jgi:hypothetical protein
VGCRRRGVFDASSSAGRLAGSIAGPAEDAWKYIGFPVDHVRIGVATLADQPDVLGHRGMSGARPLAIDDFVEIGRARIAGQLQFKLLGQ